MIESLLKNKIIDSRWPIKINETFIEGEDFLKSESCSAQCMGDLSKPVHLCEHHLAYISQKVGDDTVTICGVFLLNASTPKHLKKSEKLKIRKASLQSIKAWFELLEKKSRSLEVVIDQYAKKRLDPFHEFVKWANEIKYHAEKLIRKKSFEESSENLKSLYKTSVMLMDSLETAALYVIQKALVLDEKEVLIYIA